jgi:hypothetical protein
MHANDAKQRAAEAIRNVSKTTHLPRPLHWMTNGVVVTSNQIRRNEESGWAEP